MRSPDFKRPTHPLRESGNGNLCKYPYSLDFHVNSMGTGPWDRAGANYFQTTDPGNQWANNCEVVFALLFVQSDMAAN